jgi:hypothetical protein
MPCYDYTMMVSPIPKGRCSFTSYDQHQSAVCEYTQQVQGSEMINPNGVSRTRYEGYAKDGFIEGSQRERILYLDRNKLPGDSGEYPDAMFGGEQIFRHEFGMPNEVRYIH